MKQTFLAFAAVIATAYPSAADVTIGWNFTDLNASFDSGSPLHFSLSGIAIGNSFGTVSTPIAASSTSSGYAGSTGGGNIGNSVTTGALDTSTSGYFTFTVTPEAGYKIQLSDFDFGTRSTTTGAQAFALRADIDGFTTDFFTGTIANSGNWAFKNNSFSIVEGAADTAVVFRLYTYGGAGAASSGTITSRLDDIAVTLNAVAVPEPSAAFTALSGLGVLGSLRRRKK